MNKIIKAYDQTEDLLFITQEENPYVILRAILYYKINDYSDKALYRILKQRLTPKEEKSIKSYVFKTLL